MSTSGTDKASSDGSTGLETVSNAQQIDKASDEQGRRWVRLFVNGAPVSTANPLSVVVTTNSAPLTVEGDIAHDSPETAGSNPVKIGGYSEDAAPVLVSAVADRVNGYFDRAGRQQVNQEGTIAGENLPLNVLRTVTGKLPVEQEAWDQVNAALGTRANSRTDKTGAGRVRRITVSNGSAGEVTCIVFDNTAASGTVIDRFQVPGLAPSGVDGTAVMDYPEDGHYFATGLTWAVSTASGSVVAPATGAFVHVAYV